MDPLTRYNQDMSCRTLTWGLQSKASYRHVLSSRNLHLIKCSKERYDEAIKKQPNFLMRTLRRLYDFLPYLLVFCIWGYFYWAGIVRSYIVGQIEAGYWPLRTDVDTITNFDDFSKAAAEPLFLEYQTYQALVDELDQLMPATEWTELAEQHNKSTLADAYDPELRFWSVTYRTYTEPKETMLTILTHKGIEGLQAV